MHATLNLLTLLILPFLLPISTATHDRPAIKDSTIILTTPFTSPTCTDCPQQDCNKCTLGLSDTLEASSGGQSLVRILITFQLPPVPASRIKRCTVQFPALTRLMPAAVNVTVARALSSDWDERTVCGESAPEQGDFVAEMQVDAFNNVGALDVTDICRDAAIEQVGGRFSLYVGTVEGRIEVWSKDSGNAAILHVFTNTTTE